MGGCNQACNQIVSRCGVTVVHQPLFNCNTTYPNTNSDATGVCSQMFSYGIRNYFSVFVFIAIIFILF